MKFLFLFLAILSKVSFAGVACITIAKWETEVDEVINRDLVNRYVKDKSKLKLLFSINGTDSWSDVCATYKDNNFQVKNSCIHLFSGDEQLALVIQRDLINRYVGNLHNLLSVTSNSDERSNDEYLTCAVYHDLD